MDIDGLYRSLTQDSGLASIKATWIEQFVRSPITFWCDLHAPKELSDPIDPYVQHLFEIGHEHQSRVTAESYPGAVEQRFFLEEDGFRQTLEMMVDGQKFIKNMPLMCRSAGLEGRPDLLVRVDDIASNLGSFSYGVVEIKSARRITNAHILQAAVYNRLLGMVQGHEPDEFYIINKDSDMRTIDAVDVADELDDVLLTMREIMDGAYVDPCHGAGRWPWESYVNQLAIELNDVSLIPGVGPALRRDLTQWGFHSVNDIATTELAELVQVKGVGTSSAKKFISSASSIQQGVPIRREPTEEIFRGKTEVFFDLEGADPGNEYQGLEIVNYLIGAVARRPSGEATFASFFAETFEEEERVIKDFFRWATTLDEPVFYHWHNYERTHLTKMADHYRPPEDQVSFVLERMIDLSPLTTNAFAFPCYGQGLKDIAKCLGFKWRQDDVSATTSMALYLEYVESGGKKATCRQRIMDYNEDDCLATMYVFDWLLAER